MDLVGLFFRLDGRINRRAFWIGAAVLVVLIAAADFATRSAAPWLQILLWSLLTYPLVAVLAKRLHDRGRSGWWTLLLAAPFVVGFGAALAWRLLGAGEAAIAQAASMGLLATTLLVGLIAAVELGLRRGDPGYSRHGPPTVN